DDGGIELQQKRSVPDPGHSYLAMAELGKYRLPMLADAPSQQRLPHHLAKKRARIEMLSRRKILERARQRFAWLRRTIWCLFRHPSLTIYSIPDIAQNSNSGSNNIWLGSVPCVRKY